MRRAKKKKFPGAAVFMIIVLIVAIAAVLAKTAFDYIEWRWLLRTHPLEFTEYVQKYAEEYELDEFLIYAVIRTESSFNPDAVSSMGARGLMQIMEETFSWLSRYRLFERDMVFDDMFIPDENIRYGCYLIRYHLNQYGENTEHAMAAYFAGDQNMNRWLLAGEITDPDTNHYINKVKTAYDNYIRLYRGE